VLSMNLAVSLNIDVEEDFLLRDRHPASKNNLCLIFQNPLSYLASCVLLSRRVERIISAVAISLHLQSQDRITFGI